MTFFNSFFLYHFSCKDSLNIRINSGEWIYCIFVLLIFYAHFFCNCSFLKPLNLPVHRFAIGGNLWTIVNGNPSNYNRLFICSITARRYKATNFFIFVSLESTMFSSWYFKAKRNGFTGKDAFRKKKRSLWSCPLSVLWSFTKNI